MMRMSDSTANLFSAVSKMQAELSNVVKNKQGYGYAYADLAECIETAKEPLANNGLAVVQMLGMSDDKQGTLITMLTHESGEYIGSEFLIERALLKTKGEKNPAQEMGASITYMRRYAFASIIGMAQEDDVERKTGERPKPQPQQTQAEQKKTDADNQKHAVEHWNKVLGEIFKGEVSAMMFYVNMAIKGNHEKIEDLSLNEFILLNKHFKQFPPVLENKIF